MIKTIKIFRLRALAPLVAFTTAILVSSGLPTQALPDCRHNPDAPVCNPGRNNEPKEKSTVTVTYPDYYVVTLIYAPPGNQSEVKYGSGSSVGSRTEVTNTNKGGSVINVTTTTVDVEGKFTSGIKTGNAIEFRKEKNATLSLTADPHFDSPSHSKDVFYIWTNPQVVIEDDHQSTPLQKVQPIDGQRMQVIPVTVEELQNPSLLSHYKATQLKNLTPSDRQQILALDPFITTANLDPKRFQLVQPLQMYGPDNPGDLIPGSGLEESYDSSTDQIYGHVRNDEGTVLIGGEVNFIFKGGIKGGFTYEYEHEDIREDIQGKQQQSEVTLRTTTPCYHASVDVYFDAAFGSYAFIPRDASTSCTDQPSLMGKVLDDQGNPLFNQQVTVALPNGSQRVVFTNAQGTYRVFGVPADQAARSQLRLTGSGKIVPNRSIHDSVRVVPNRSIHDSLPLERTRSIHL